MFSLEVLITQAFRDEKCRESDFGRYNIWAEAHHSKLRLIYTHLMKMLSIYPLKMETMISHLKPAKFPLFTLSSDCIVVSL